MKDKSIIEKLGITPGPWVVKTPHICDMVILPRIADCGYGHSYFAFGGSSDPEVREPHLRVCAAAPQLLESLIEITIEDDENFMSGTPLRAGVDKRIALIESASPKSWAEIKDLMEGET